jgi:predicted XRE-type DNA-binding protein
MTRLTVGEVLTDVNTEMELLARIVIATERMVELLEQSPRRRRKNRRESQTIEEAGRLRALREMVVREPNLTQSQIAERFDVDRSSVSRWLKQLSALSGHNVRRGVSSRNKDGSVSIDGVTDE